MSPVTGLARKAGRILPSVHTEIFNPVIELRFQPGYCSYEGRWRTHRFRPRLRKDPVIAVDMARKKLGCSYGLIPVTALECSYRKISSPVTEISITGLVRLLI